MRARDRIPRGAPSGTTVGGEGDARARSERLRIRVGPSGQVAIDPEADADDGAGRRRDRADVLHGGRKGQRRTGRGALRSEVDRRDDEIGPHAERNGELVVAFIALADAVHVIDPSF